MARVSDDGGNRLPDDVSPDLWVTAEGYLDRLYLGWKPAIRTPGRIGAWSVECGSGTRISKADIITSSPDAAIWVKAYLIGSQPSIEFMFGNQVNDDPDYEGKFARWQRHCSDFLETGYWAGGEWFEPEPIANGDPLPNYVWLRRGDEIWFWDNGEWRFDEARPPSNGWFITDSLCANRQWHAPSGDWDNYMICADCGFAIGIQVVEAIEAEATDA